MDGERRILHTPISILWLSAIGSLLVATDGIGAIESHNHKQGLKQILETRINLALVDAVVSQDEPAENEDQGANELVE